MLVITAIYENNRNVTYYRYMTKTNDSFFVVQDTRAITFDIKDTDSDNMYRGVELKKILNKPFLLNVLGVIKDNDSLLFVPLDIVTWKILDYIDEVKDCEVVYCNKDFLRQDFPDIQFIETNIVSHCPISKFVSHNGVVYSFHLDYKIERLDEDGLFWRLRDNVYSTLQFMYKCLNAVDNTNCIAIYVQDSKRNTIKLTVSQDIIRLMTKITVMGNKFHW